MEPDTSHLGHRDWAALECALRGIFAEGLSQKNYVQRGLVAVQSLVPGEFATYSWGRQKGFFDIVFSTTDNLWRPALEAFVQIKDTHPLWRSDVGLHGGLPGLRSDYFSERAFRRTNIYNETYRPLGLRNHCCIPLTSDGDVAVHFSVQRGRGPDFTERDRQVIALLVPHLRAARALARGRGHIGPIAPEVFAPLGLTPRECDVLYWLFEGKQNTEIAAILRVGVQTVKSHVSAIFTKLRVENRHAAIRLACEFARTSQPDELTAATHHYWTFRSDRAERNAATPAR